MPAPKDNTFAQKPDEEKNTAVIYTRMTPDERKTVLRAHGALISHQDAKISLSNWSKEVLLDASAKILKKYNET